MLEAIDHFATQLVLMTENITPGPDQMFVVVDGDHIGNSAATPLLHNDVETAMEVSKLIHKGQDFISWWAKHGGGQSLIDGGDNSVLLMPKNCDLEDLRAGYHELTGFTLSCGTGPTSEHADKALVVAKWRGRDQVAHYDRNCEIDFGYAQNEASDAKKMAAEIGEAMEASTVPGTPAEGFELSGQDFQLLQKVGQGAKVNPQDPGIAYLTDVGLLAVSSTGLPVLSALGKMHLS